MVVEITMMRAFKILWSFIWRTWILLIPTFFAFAAVIAVAFIMGGGLDLIKTGHFNPQAFTGRQFIAAAVLYILIWPTMLVLQIYAFKLALKAQWSDFKLVAVSTTSVPTSL